MYVNNAVTVKMLKLEVLSNRTAQQLILLESFHDLNRTKHEIRYIHKKLIQTFAKNSSSAKTRTPVEARALETSRQALCDTMVAADSVKPIVWFPPFLTVGIAIKNKIIRPVRCLGIEIVAYQIRGATRGVLQNEIVRRETDLR